MKHYTPATYGSCYLLPFYLSRMYFVRLLFCIFFLALCVRENENMLPKRLAIVYDEIRVSTI